MRKAPILIDTLRALVATQPDTLLGLRNRALLLVAFTSLWRRSELSSLVWGCVLPSRLGPATLLVLPRAKADQEGHGTETPILPGANPATCPVRALEAWRRALVAGTSVESDTPVFRPVTRHGRVLPRALTAESIGDVVQRAVAQAKATLEATARALEVQEPAAPVAERRLAWTAVAALHQLDAGRIDAWEHYARERTAVRAERAAARRAARVARHQLRRAGRHAEAEALGPRLAPWPKPPSTRSTVGGHSTRAGGITAAVLANKPVPLSRQLSRHTSDAFFDYVREVERQRTNVMADLGL